MQKKKKYYLRFLCEIPIPLLKQQSGLSPSYACSMHTICWLSPYSTTTTMHTTTHHQNEVHQVVRTVRYQCAAAAGGAIAIFSLPYRRRRRDGESICPTYVRSSDPPPSLSLSRIGLKNFAPVRARNIQYNEWYWRGVVFGCRRPDDFNVSHSSGSFCHIILHQHSHTTYDQEPEHCTIQLLCSTTNPLDKSISKSEECDLYSFSIESFAWSDRITQHDSHHIIVVTTVVATVVGVVDSNPQRFAPIH